MVLTDLDLACQLPHLAKFGASPNSGSASTIGTFQMGRSGESVLYSPTDSQGRPLTVTSLRNTDDVQILSLTGIPSSTSLTLGFGTVSTAPIALQPAPPLTSFVWSAVLPAPGSFDLSHAFGYSGTPPTGRACTNALMEIFDSTTLIGSLTLDQSVYPDPATDLGVPTVGLFKALGTFAFKSTNLQLRLSGEAGNGILLAGMIRVAPSGSSDPTQVGFIDPAYYRVGGTDGSLEGRAGVAKFGDWNLDYFYTSVASWHAFWYALPTGTRSTALPTEADLRSALLALPTIPPGSLTITAVTNLTYAISFAGVLSGKAMPTLIPSDPAFRINHDDTAGSSVGGQFPELQINGATYPLRAASYASGRSVVLFHLVQDAPPVQYARSGQGLFDNQYAQVIYGLGFSKQTALTSQAGRIGTCQFQGLPGPAEYQIDLTWPAGDGQADKMQCVIQDGLGNTLRSIPAIDQSQAPGDFQENGASWMTLGRFTCPARVNTFVITFSCPNPSGGKHCLLDTVRLGRLSPATSTAITAGDTVLFTAPAGFVTTSDGPMPAADLVQVLPAPAQRVPALDSGLKTMKLGMNCDYPTYYGVDSCFANIAVQTHTPVGLAQDAAGNPTKLASDGARGIGYGGTQLTQTPDDAHGSSLGVPNCGNGVWIVEWSSKLGDTCAISGFVGTTTVVEDPSRRVSGPVNRRYYLVEDAIKAAPSVRIEFFSSRPNADGTFACDIHGVAVYPSDVADDQTHRWRPAFLAKVKQLHCFRFMDLFGTNNMNLARFADFPQPENFPLGYAARTMTAPIATIGPPTIDPFNDHVSGTVVRVTTTVPHGLTTGFLVGLRTTDNSSLGVVLGNVVDPTTKQTTTTPRAPLDPTDGPQYARNMCRVIDATTLQIGIEVYSGPLARMTNTLTPPNGFVYAEVAPGAMMAPADATQLCVDAQVEPWVNVPWLADDDCVTRLAQAFVNQIPPGTEVHVEYGNEAWNYAFYGYFFCANQSNLLYGAPNNYIPFYVARMGQVHQTFRDVWARAGRNPSEIRRVCGTQAGNAGGTTTPIIQYALEHGISFDELAPASYFNNEPLRGAYDDLLTRAQLLDLLAVNVRLSVTTDLMNDQNRAVASALAANPHQTWLGQIALVNYEGGPDTMTTATMSANIANRNHAVHRDPDFLEIMLYQLQTLQDAGVRLFNIFSMYGTRDLNQWGVYEGFQMPPGSGSVALDPANRADFDNLLAIKSETGGALNQWVALMSPPAPGGSVTRNGTVEAFGRIAY